MKCDDFISAFVLVAECRSEEVAIETRGGRAITYSGLLNAAGRLAETMASIDADHVALNMPRSAEFVAGLLATWMAGKVALILDPDWPEARMRVVLDRARPGLVLNQEEINWDGVSSGRETSFLPADPDSPAYVIHTSGSTGQPKGVVVPHRGLCPMLMEQIEAFRLRRGARCYWMHGVAFDASVSDIGTALLSGATLCIDPDIDYAGLLEVWRDMSITHVDLPPALLGDLRPEQAPSSLETIIVGGQVCDPLAIRQWTRVVRIVNVYGPTEATVCSSLVVCDEDWSRPLIGSPVADVEYEMNEETGELLIVGQGVALGYLDDPELTAERFSARGSKRVFHTRDRVKRLPDGNYEFMGRLDRQVKVHGRLVHPEEVERRLQEMPQVREAVVSVFDGSLAACVSPSSLSRSGLIDGLRENLPDWMCPSLWRFVDVVPYGENGKPDLSAINDLFVGGDEVCQPRTPTEQCVARVYCHALDRAGLGLDDSFGEWGGDSLAVIRALLQAEREGLSLSAEAIERFPTIRRLAAAIDTGLSLGAGRGVGNLLSRIENLVLRSPVPSSRLGAPRQVLLTGASGFFGAAILGELLTRHPDWKVVCLVRGGGRERILRGLEKHGFEVRSGFECVTGDLCRPQLGLTAENWEALSLGIDTVVHSAADTSLTATFESLFDANVLGCRHILDLVGSGTPKMLHHISTLSVFVDAAPIPAVCLEEDNLSRTERVFGGYAQSKWAAEQLVRKSLESDAVAIHRPGLLVANSRTGHAPAKDWFASFLSRHKFGDGENVGRTCDFTPVDEAAGKLARLIESHLPGTFHLAGITPMTYERLRAVSVASDDELPDISSLALKSGNSPFRVFKTTGTRISVTNTERALSETLEP